jgi:hypothetical protein
LTLASLKDFRAKSNTGLLYSSGKWQLGALASFLSFSARFILNTHPASYLHELTPNQESAKSERTSLAGPILEMIIAMAVSAAAL